MKTNLDIRIMTNIGFHPCYIKRSTLRSVFNTYFITFQREKIETRLKSLNQYDNNMQDNLLVVQITVVP